MKVLIDTHIALWAIEEDPQLPQKAREILMDDSNEIFYSIASDARFVDARLSRTVCYFGLKMQGRDIAVRKEDCLL